MPDQNARRTSTLSGLNRLEHPILVERGRIERSVAVFRRQRGAGVLQRARDQMGFTALDNVAAVLDGRPALDPA